MPAVAAQRARRAPRPARGRARARRRRSRRAEESLAGRGRVFLRYSGTEALLRDPRRGTRTRRKCSRSPTSSRPSPAGSCPTEQRAAAVGAASAPSSSTPAARSSTWTASGSARAAGADVRRAPRSTRAEAAAVAAVQLWILERTRLDGRRAPPRSSSRRSWRTLRVATEGRRRGRGARIAAEHGRANLWSRGLPGRAPATLEALARAGLPDWASSPTRTDACAGSSSDAGLSPLPRGRRRLRRGRRREAGPAHLPRRDRAARTRAVRLRLRRRHLRDRRRSARGGAGCAPSSSARARRRGRARERTCDADLARLDRARSSLFPRA